jgi:uncharacterized membrane protein
MNTLTPWFIASAILLPVLVLMVVLYLWVQRHRQPDIARLRIYWALLVFLGVLTLVALLAHIFIKDSGSSSLLVPASLCLAVTGALIQICQCKRRLGQK